jgi:uncharacterized protein (TIGR03435 family)
MNSVDFIWAEPWVERLGLTLVHFLWQGILIAFVYGMMRLALGAAKPYSRYILGTVALSVMVCTPVITFISLEETGFISSTRRTVYVPTAPIAPDVDAAGLQTGVQLPASVYATRGTVLIWIAVLWFSGAVALWMRLIRGCLTVIRLRSTHSRPAPGEWQNVTRELALRMGLSGPVPLMVCVRVYAPTVIGWIRPVILMPIGALTGLPKEYVEALLAHELAHIRRRDYLINILQSVAEGLLFYHPAVWWISKHIRNERELCCDDVAVSVTGNALTYVRALAEAETYRSVHFKTAMAVTGGSLESRIARLLGEPQPYSPIRLAPGVLVSAILLLVAAYGVFGQSSLPRFEVASIRLNPSVASDTVALNGIRNPGFVNILPEGVVVAGWTVPQSLIQEAYNLKPYQISGGPEWIRSVHYDINATANVGSNRQQMRIMLQSLLADRFKLKAHRETRLLPAYALTAPLGTSKLQAADERNCRPRGASIPPLPPPTGLTWLPFPMPCGRAQVSVVSGHEAHLIAGQVSMEQLSADLSNILGHTVIDRTVGEGTFDLDVVFTPDESLAGLRNSMDGQNAADPVRGSLITALQEKTGLKLEIGKTPVEVLVVDYIEPPNTDRSTNEQPVLIAESVVSPSVPLHPIGRVPELRPPSVPTQNPEADRTVASPQNYIQQLAQAGYSNLSADDLISFKIHGVTADYARSLQDIGFTPSLSEILSMRIHGVTSEYAQALRAAGFTNLTMDELLSGRIHGLTPEFISSLQDLGFSTLSFEQAITARIHGITPAFVREAQQLGLQDLTFNKIVALKIHGVLGSQ